MVRVRVRRHVSRRRGRDRRRFIGERATRRRRVGRHTSWRRGSNRRRRRTRRWGGVAGSALSKYSLARWGHLSGNSR